MRKHKILGILTIICLLVFNSSFAFAETKEDKDKLIKSYVGKTYWVQRSVLSDFNFITEKMQSCLVDLKTDERPSVDKSPFFMKLTIDEIMKDTFDGKEYNYYIATYNNRKYFFSVDYLLNAKPDSYEIFDKDPKTVFKFSKEDWDSLDKGNIWLGMNRDQLTMIMGKPTKVNRMGVKGTVQEQWCYLYDSKYFDDEYYYFENNKLVGWQD